MGEEWTIIISSTAANSESMGPLDEPKKIVVKLDANGNIKMSNSEIKEILLPLFPVSAEEEVDRVVTETDGDSDGVICPDQFIRFLRKEAIRNGLVLTLLLMREMPIHPGPLAPAVTVPGTQEAQRITAEIDKDGDGFVDFKDLAGSLRKEVCIDVDGSSVFDPIPEANALTDNYVKWMKWTVILLLITAFGAFATAYILSKAMSSAAGFIACVMVMLLPGIWDKKAATKVVMCVGIWDKKAAAKVLAKFAAAGCAVAVLTLLASDLPRDYAWIAIGVALVIPLCAVSLA